MTIVDCREKQQLRSASSEQPSKITVLDVTGTENGLTDVGKMLEFEKVENDDTAIGVNVGVRLS